MTKALVTACFIKPMMTVCHPPAHMRGSPLAEITVLAEEIYCDTLQRYSRPVLLKAWPRIKSELKSWAWPALGDVSRICAEIDKNERPACATANDTKMPWELRRIQAEDLKVKFMASIPRNSLALRALAENWYYNPLGLRAYFSEHATFQSQVLTGSIARSWTSWAWGYGTWIKDGTHDYKRDLATEAAETEQRGSIDISVPDLALHWFRTAISE